MGVSLYMALLIYSRCTYTLAQLDLNGRGWGLSSVSVETPSPPRPSPLF